MSLDVVKAEMESVGKAHQNVAQQMKSELDEALSAFAGGMKERRKLVQNGIEKLLKTKQQQTVAVNKVSSIYVVWATVSLTPSSYRQKSGLRKTASRSRATWLKRT